MGRGLLIGLSALPLACVCGLGLLSGQDRRRPVFPQMDLQVAPILTASEQVTIEALNGSAGAPTTREAEPLMGKRALSILSEMGIDKDRAKPSFQDKWKYLAKFKLGRDQVCLFLDPDTDLIGLAIGPACRVSDRASAPRAARALKAEFDAVLTGADGR